MSERIASVLTRIRHLLAAPTFEGDEERTRQARLLNTILLTWFAGTVTVTTFAPFMRISLRLWLLTGLPPTILVVALWLLMRRGRVRLVGTLLSLGLGLFFTFLAYAFGGVSEPSYPGYIAVVLIAGLLLGGRAAIVAAVGGMLAGLAILVLETQGLLPPSMMEVTPTFAWIVGTINLALSALILYLATESVDSALERLRRNQRALSESNRELQREIAERQRAESALQQAHDELEVRVQERTAALVETNYALQILVSEHKQAEEQIRASLQEKEVLLQEIHHRVKNNLQIISSLLNLQSIYIDDEQLLTMFVESQNRIRSMALVHERLYRSPNIAQIEFGTYIRQLTQQLLGTYRSELDQVALQIDVQEDVALAIDEAVPCGLILNELVSNALKHAFPGGRAGEICVALHRQDRERAILSVRDDGIGFPEDLDLYGTDSLGMQLVTTLVDQLDGTIELDRRGGTTFRIEFTVPPIDNGK